MVNKLIPVFYYYFSFIYNINFVLVTASKSKVQLGILGGCTGRYILALVKPRHFFKLLKFSQNAK